MKIENSLPRPQLPESPPQTGLQFTVATEEDFDEIMAISQDIYGGLDYLPTRYAAWLSESNRTVILARKQGKVIALESVCVIDDGETMLVEGLRVAPQERGKGVAGVLLRFCSQLVKTKWPEVKVTRLTRDDQLGPKDFQKYRLITKQGILLVRFNAEDLKLRLSELGLRVTPPPPLRVYLPGFGHPTGSSSPSGPNEVHQMFINSGLLSDVLPNSTIVQDWQPFKPLPSNMAILLKKDIDWMVDDRNAPAVVSLCTHPFWVPGGPHRLGDNTYYLNIDMFGKDIDLVLQQFLSHLRRHTTSLKGYVMCQMFLDPPMWKPMAEFCRQTLKVELVKEYTEQCVVEADVV
ncbi:LOW QUALITY PROTEIN: histidine N-acetyltransferase [Esox lucius]|uniref:LOW QUALITY PROTEIN: histidine N-acetyltransferase n=1 Tax=Esox lucius TaxID=8010 RepID=UPI001476F4AF|nr:LOW QUALITY PROTEIN: histidine N-acetyltransferase [Esox lucius]